MIKKEPYGSTLRERLEANARDRLYQFLLDFGSVRAALVHSTRMVNEVRANHDLGPLETLILGRAYIACGLMTTNLKGNDRLRLQVEGDGPVQGLSVEGNAFGEIRGYLMRNPIPVDEKHSNLSSLFGKGVLSVTRYLEKAKQPFSGQVPLEYGSLAEDLAFYFLHSEQTPSAFRFSIRFDPKGRVAGAGGLFLQVLPGIEPNKIDLLEEIVRTLPSIGEAFAQGQTPEQFIEKHFSTLTPLMLSNRRIEFMCHCGEKRFRTFLGALPKEELADILQNGPLPIVTTCWNCNSSYSFSEQEIRRLYQSK